MIWEKLSIKNHLWSGAGGPSDSYWLMRRIFATGLGLIYLNAFLIYWNQGLGLFGSQGILPIKDYIPQVLNYFGSVEKALWQLPGIFLFNQSDELILFVGALGIFLSLPLIFGFVNFPILLALWILHISVIHAGQIFYSYGWETQLLELTFLSFFLFPFWNPRLDNPASPPKKISVYFLRWMMFRLMLGAGLIKLRGDPCWTDFTCMVYHYETQPNPLPFSWWLHKMPAWFHSLEVGFNHFVEVIAPFGLFGPKKLRRATGVLMILFQVFLILSGNLAWLNWITILMAIPCFDDEFLGRFLKLKKYLVIKTPEALPKRSLITLSLFAIVSAILSIQPALNLFSEQQAMNASFNQFHLINSYGAFGAIGKERFEVVISGTENEQITSDTVWREYEFKCKPGDTAKAPCWVTPYHLRLDWQIWFSAMRPELSEPWLANLAVRLLQGTPEVLELLEKNPFPQNPPRFLKMDLYRYQYTDWNQAGWWKRSFVKTYAGPMSLNK